MEQISKVRKCYKCGVTLQCDDPEKEGYVRPEVFDNPNQSFYFCNKCFEAEKFHTTSNEPYIDEDFITILNEAKEKNCLLVYVVNLLSFETSFSKEVIDLIQGMKILVVATKFDLLPVGVKEDDILEYVAHRFRVAGIQITHDDVMIHHNNDEDSSRDVLTRIFELKNAKSVYVIGCEDAGKTAMISSFLKIYSNFSSGNIVTHEYKGTHLRVMEIPLTNKSSMFETPGISRTNSILFGLDSKTLKSIYLKEPAEPRKISLSEGSSLFIGGLAIIQLIEGDRANMICYFHKNVVLEKTHRSDIEKKFLHLIKHNELQPSLSKLKSTTDMDVFDIEMKDGDGSYRDLGFAGLGWVSIAARKQKFRIYVPKGVSIYTSRPKVKKQ